jgi:hypothetical protein
MLQVLRHALLNVLEVNVDGQIINAITQAEVEDPNDLFLMDPSNLTVQTEVYMADDNVKTTVRMISEPNAMKLKRFLEYVDHAINKDGLSWDTITKADFQKWINGNNFFTPMKQRPSTSLTPDTIGSTLTTTGGNTFRSNIKFSNADYPKLMDDKKWLLYKRLLHASAASHDTCDLLNVDYVPDDENCPNYKQKSRFLFCMFSNNIQTSKGKLCIKKHEKSMDGAKVYKELVSAYDDTLTSSLASSYLREQITLMKLDDKWKASYEEFLNHWSTKIYELETLEDIIVDDEQRRIWLTSALIGNNAMQQTIRNAQTNELTFRSLNKDPDFKLPWESYYCIILNNAKILDQQHKTPRSTNKMDQKKTDSYTQKSDSDKYSKSEDTKKYTKYTGANMKMRSDMLFTSEDWRKLTEDQKTRLIKLKKDIRKSKRDKKKKNNDSEEKEKSDTPTDIRSILSSKTSKTPREVKTCKVSYRISAAHTQTHKGSLLDGGANGGMSGSDVTVLNETTDKVDIVGIANNNLVDITLATVAGLIDTDKGPIIGIFHQYAHQGDGHTIHSVNQLKHFGCTIDETPRSLEGTQTMTTPEGYIIPIQIRNGLPYIDMSPPNDHDLETYPHVVLTSDMPWDPSILDDEYLTEEVQDGHQAEDHEDIKSLGVYKAFTMPKPRDLNKLKPHFGYAPRERIKHTLENSTQFARLDTRLPLRTHFKSRYPAANVKRINEQVATDTFFSDTEAHSDGILDHAGATMVQLYCGCDSQFTAVFPMTTEKNMHHTLEDFIRQYGAPHTLFSDNAKTQIGKAVQDILRIYAINDFQCEPHHQHQNYAERRIQEIKKYTNLIMDRVGAPPTYWLLCLEYVVYLINRLSVQSLHWKTPFEVFTGQKPDISALMAFYWFQPVYYLHPDKKFPSKSSEKSGRMVGIATHKGDIMTFLVMDDVTKLVLPRSELRSADDISTQNLRTNGVTPSQDDGENFVMSSIDIAELDIDSSLLKLPHLNPTDIVGHSFIKPDDHGNHYRATIVKRLKDQQKEGHDSIAQYLVSNYNEEIEEVLNYNEILSYISSQLTAPEESQVYTFSRILDHEGPLTAKHPNYKGSKYNLLIQWDSGEETYEPLEIILADDPISVSQYGEENDLLDKPGWKRVQRLFKNKARMKRTIHKIKSTPSGPRYQFGTQVPRNVKEALELDKRNGNNKWRDAMQEEIDSLNAYNTFKDKGKIKHLEGYKKIIVHFVFAVKHDLRHKARLVAGGHLTDPTTEGTYSGVVQLRSIRLCILLAELNGLDIWVGDISSAYLEAFTKEKVCFTAGQEFGDLEGNLLVIDRALYGLRTSGARWHDRFAETLNNMEFFVCKADPDVWLKDCKTHYEYVCVYVDDIMFFGKDPKSFFDALSKDHNYQLKGVGKPTYHLGGDFGRDDKDGTFTWGAKSYVKKMLANYKLMYNEEPKPVNIPLPEKDHPELDTTTELDADGIKQYQSLIGALQWLVTLGRFDILCAVSTMGSYRANPRQGHLDRLKRIYGYIKKFPDGAIRFRTNIPDHESFGTPAEYEWTSVYGNPKEEIPTDMPVPKGKMVRTTTYADANLMHCLVTGRSMSGILHLVNQTPIQWFSKKQNTVETATYGSEFMVARQACEQIMDLRYTLRMLGAPLDGPSWLFGDNQSVITSSTIPQSNLNKRHNALSYHRVRECIAAKILNFLHVASQYNPSDFLTKFLVYTKFRPLVQPLLFWKGDTLDIKSRLPLVEEMKQSDDGTMPLRGVSNSTQNNGTETTQNKEVNAKEPSQEVSSDKAKSITWKLDLEEFLDEESSDGQSLEPWKTVSRRKKAKNK